MNAESIVTEDDVRALLDAIPDPCSQAAGVPIGIVAMGLVTDVEVAQTDRGVDVEVAIGVTDPVCWMGAAFMAAARTALTAHDGIAGVDVRLDRELDWTEDHMDPSARERLNRSRAARRGALPVVELTDARTHITAISERS